MHMGLPKLNRDFRELLWFLARRDPVAADLEEIKMPTRNFRQLIDAMPPVRRHEIEQRFQERLAAIPLHPSAVPEDATPGPVSKCTKHVGSKADMAS